MYLAAALSVVPMVNCAYRGVKNPTITLDAPSMVQSNKEINLVVLPHEGRRPAQILFTQSDRYHFTGSPNRNSFKKEMTINPLMHDVKLKAQIMVGAKVVREYTAHKSIQTLQSDNKSTWTAGRAKLSLEINNLAPNEDVVVKTEYSWMEPRFIWPLFLESAEATGTSRITVDVPFGVVPRFKMSKAGEHFPFTPADENVENPRWGQKDNRTGLGKRYVFAHDFGLKPSAPHPSERMQLFVSFDMPMQHDKSSLFINWEAVSSFLYSRIDRYDLASNAIREFTEKECLDKENELAQVMRIISFLKNDIENRAVMGSFLEQEIQTATRTFAQRFGSYIDKSVLLLAMLKSIGIKATLLALSTPTENPRLTDFYSPALFYKVIVAIDVSEQTFYVDFSEDFERLDTLPPKLQGQNVLSIEKNKGQFFALPFSAPENNETRLAYELALTPQGQLEGNFSLSFNGVRAESLRSLLAKKERALSAPELQNLLELSDQAMRWQSAALSDQKSSNETLINGYIVPQLLKRNGHELVINISDILQPALAPILHTSPQRFSSITRLQARLSIPENYAVDIKPHDGFIRGAGISGRYQVSFKEGMLFFEGEAIVSLPISNTYKQELDAELKTLVTFSETKLGITMLEKTGSHDSEKPSQEQSS